MREAGNTGVGSPYKVKASYQDREPRTYEQPVGRDRELACLTARRRYCADLGLSRYLLDKIKTEILEGNK